jgi:hypothetical protein
MEATTPRHDSATHDIELLEGVTALRLDIAELRGWTREEFARARHERAQELTALRALLAQDLDRLRERQMLTQRELNRWSIVLATGQVLALVALGARLL